MPGHHDVRKGIANAALNQENSKILNTEIFIIAIVFGFYFKSWVIFGGTLIGLYIAALVKPLAIILLIALSLCWGVIGYCVGNFFGSVAASFVLGGLGFATGLACHSSALEWVKDITSNE